MADRFNIRAIEGLLPAAYNQTVMGVVVQSPVNASQLAVNVQGNVLAARWADPIVCAAGDTVLVHLVIGRTGLTEAIVQGRVSSNPRPGQGTVTVVPPSSATVTVQGTDGMTYTAGFVTTYTPTVNDNVTLSWFGFQPTIMGKVAVTPAPPTPVPPPPPAPPPPPPPQTGQSAYPASGSSTFWPSGGWDSWAGGMGRVYQGQYGSGQVYGAWFYNGSPGQLAGRTITRFQILLGNRLGAGSWSAPVTVHFYVHSNASKPGQFTDVTRVSGPYDVTANPGQGLTAYDLPVSAAGTVINGGGVGIALDPYAGFLGAQEQPDSGKLIFDWRM